ncbi:MAG: transposase [Marinomonas foliarum]
MLRINETFSFQESIYRVLACTDDGVIWIDVYDSKALPKKVSFIEIGIIQASGQLTPTPDPFLDEINSSSFIGNPVALEKRDERYALIRSLIQNEDIFTPSLRSEMINLVVSEGKATKKTIYRLLRAFWQRGLNKDALIPRYSARGGKNDLRVLKKKLGRPSVFSIDDCRQNIKQEYKELFDVAIKENLLIQDPTSQKDAYLAFRHLLSVRSPELESLAYPTLRQFTYYYRRNYSIDKRIKAQNTESNFNKDHRPIKSTATTHTLGPGSRYEIDATIADIYLVSDKDRSQIIGRPTIYFVIDVYSRLIAGLYVGFSSPSYVSAMQALTMACKDKVQFCKSFGVEIDESEWPAFGLPDAILADRGELMGHQIETIIDGFGVRIENAPPRRGDAKGIVERAFRTVQEKFKPYCPGIVQGTLVKKNGGKDYRLEANLTITEFMQVILKIVIHHNNYKQLSAYDPDEYFPAAIPWVPKHIWNWGVQHKSGMLRAADAELFRIGTLPRIRATMSEKGLKVWGVYYTSQEILNSGWLTRYQGHARPQDLVAAYDPDDADRIFLFTDKFCKSYWVCKIADRSRRYRGMTFWAVWEKQYEEKKAKSDFKSTEYEKDTELMLFLNETKKNAKKMAKESYSESDSQRIKNIKKNKSEAIAEERSKRGKTANQDDSVSPDKADVIKLPSADEDYDYPSFVPELFGDDNESND